MEDWRGEEPEKPLRPSKPKLSKTPSWIMLGFLLGVGFMLALPPLRRKSPPPPERRIEAPKPVPPPEPQLTTVEAIFEQWRPFAAWDDDGATQFALWNSETRDYTDYYEARRIGDEVYVRSIMRLTRILMREDSRLAPESPIRFTAPSRDAPVPASPPLRRPETLKQSAPDLRREKTEMAPIVPAPSPKLEHPDILPPKG